jgi:hypothetical protein
LNGHRGTLVAATQPGTSLLCTQFQVLSGTRTAD